MSDAQSTPTTAAPISDERVEAARERIKALCAQAYQEGYELGVKRGFELATVAQTAVVVEGTQRGKVVLTDEPN